MSILDSILRVVDARLARLDTHALYEGTVVQQTADGDLEVELDDDRFGVGITHLQIAFGIPGVTVSVAKGTRVAVGFHDGKRDRPIVRHWLSGDAVVLTINATTINFGDPLTAKPVARLADMAGPYVITTGSAKVNAE